MSPASESWVRLSRGLEDAASAALSIGRAWVGGKKFILVEGVDERFHLRPALGKPMPAGTLKFVHGRFVDEGASGLGARLAGAELEIVLSASRFLFRTLELPGGANEFLDAIVGRQIDRLTPWSAARAEFGRGAPSPISGGRVAVTVAAISRASITPIVDAIEAFKPETIVISTEPEASADRIVVLTRQANREGRLRRARARLVGALALAGFAAAICMGLWIFVGNSLSTARDEVAREIADRRAILAGRQDVGDSAATALARTKRTAAASVIILEELSRALPDDTYLTRMKIHDGKVEIAGVTREAAALIKILEQTEAFQRATFSAPTTQTPGDDNEQFQIEADIKPTLAVTP